MNPVELLNSTSEEFARATHSIRKRNAFESRRNNEIHNDWLSFRVAKIRKALHVSIHKRFPVDFSNSTSEDWGKRNAFESRRNDELA